MKTLAELAEIEESLVARAESLSGFPGERHVVLEATGIPHEYAAVLTAYTDLLSDPRARLEALKRATFLVWYAVAEPPEFTGLWAITPQHESRVVAALESELAGDGGDEELRAMLTWYVRVMGGAAFSDYPGHRALASFCEQADDAEEPQSGWRPKNAAHRGQMGHYWRSLRHDA